MVAPTRSRCVPRKGRVMDAPRPIAWRLQARDFTGHRLGGPPPPCLRRRFRTREAAVAELNRLRADGAQVVGGIVAILPKFAAVQDDLGFPPADGPRRMTD
jgi:hypothetical protein